jgi:hypothetical protein
MVQKKEKENHDPPNSMTIMSSNNNIYNGQSGDGSDRHFIVPHCSKR